MKKTQSQKILIPLLVIIIIIIAFLFNKANSNQQALKKHLVVLEDSVKRLNNEIAFNELRNEVLKELNNNLSSKIYTKGHKHVETKAVELSKDEKEVQSMIVQMEDGWAQMMEQKNPNLLLKFFLDQYTTNSVKISTDNMPFVQRHNNSDFKTHLNQLIATKELSLSFDQPSFYSTMVRGNIFTTNYLSRLTAKHEGKVIHKSTILCFVSGQKKNGKWLVGNYNWTRYDDFDASKNHSELML
jgi:hypothetical protein